MGRGPLRPSHPGATPRRYVPSATRTAAARRGNFRHRRSERGSRRCAGRCCASRSGHSRGSGPAVRDRHRAPGRSALRSAGLFRCRRCADEPRRADRRRPSVPQPSGRQAAGPAWQEVSSSVKSVRFGRKDRQNPVTDRIRRQKRRWARKNLALTALCTIFTA